MLYETFTKFTCEEYKKAFWGPREAKKGWTVYFAMLSALNLIGIAVWYFFYDISFLLAMVSISIILTSVLLFKINYSFSNHFPNKNKLIRYKFFSDYFEIETENTNARTRYSDLYKIVETKENFYLCVSINRFHVIIKSNCSAELISFLRDLAANAKPSVRQMSVDHFNFDRPYPAENKRINYKTWIAYTIDQHRKGIYNTFFAGTGGKLIAGIFALMISHAIFAKDIISNLILFVFIAAIIPIIAEIKLRINFKTNKLIQNTIINFTFHEDCVEIEDKQGKSCLAYTKILKIHESKNNFYLLVSPGNYYIVDKRNCSDELIAFIRNTASAIKSGDFTRESA